MSDLEKEKAIINESPDFETQREILNEEKIAQKKQRKFYTHVGCVFFLTFLMIIIAYITIDLYKEYNFFGSDACDNENINSDGVDFAKVNITKGDSCLPEYNIDYRNNRRATFNVDLFGDQSVIFNPINQKDENGVCRVNCDADNDNWPDYNIDLDGDGVPDINIVKDYSKNTTCSLNCDLNGDTIPDTNIDVDGDGEPDVNITDENDSTIPKYNVDYKGDRTPHFNVKEDDGSISNKVNEVTPGVKCTENCDIDGDGWPDYNIKFPGSDQTLNELVSEGDNEAGYDKGKSVHWKCFFDKSLPSCDTGKNTTNNKYLNVDVDGDGKPDVNVSDDGGETVTNPLNKPGTYNGKDVTLNEDYTGDGFPDYNIDIDNDGIPDLNITEPGSHVCTKNCDTNYDGVPDYFIDYGNNGNTLNPEDENLDIDFDKKCDLNCDTNYDLYPDYNIDTDGDGKPDVNVDVDGDGIPDYNIDTNGDHRPDQNLSPRLDGTCSFNCVGKPETNVDSSNTCTKNCDTDGDGWPDTNVDLNNDGVCDINCENGQTNVDKNKDYFVDEEDKTYDATIDTDTNDDTFYVLNPLDIKGVDIEPGWNDTFVLEVINNASYAVAYKLEWSDILNEFTEENNLYYDIFKNGGNFINNARTPYGNEVLNDEIYLRPKSTVRYVLNIKFQETNQNQNVDSGKQFKGKLIINMKK